MNIKKAVFLPQDIYSDKPTRFGQKPQHSYFDSDGDHNMYSKGNLNRAIEKKYEIYVCLLKPFSPNDSWWAKYVKPENIISPDFRHAFFPYEHEFNSTPNPDSYPAFRKIELDGLSCPIILGVWKRLYEKLGLEWDKSFQNWDIAMNMLTLYSDIKLGKEF